MNLFERLENLKKPKYDSAGFLENLVPEEMEIALELVETLEIPYSTNSYERIIGSRINLHPGLSHVNNLYLDGMKLEEVPELVRHFSELKVLNLFYNNITHLPEFLLDLPLVSIGTYETPIVNDDICKKLEDKGSSISHYHITH